MARARCHVAHRVQAREVVGDLAQGSGDAAKADPDVQAVADLRLVDDRQDPHGAGLDQAPEAVPDGALAHSETARELGVAHPAVELQRGNQHPIGLIEAHSAANLPGGYGSVKQHDWTLGNACGNRTLPAILPRRRIIHGTVRDAWSSRLDDGVTWGSGYGRGEFR